MNKQFFPSNFWGALQSTEGVNERKVNEQNLLILS